MRERALVMEVENQRVTVALPGGRFQRLRLSQPVVVGQEIWLESRQPRDIYALSAAAAVFLLAIGVVGPHLMTPSAPAVAAFSLDFAPSIDFGVSKSGRVVSVKAFNQAGARLLRQASVMGMPATKAALTLTRVGVQDHMVSTAEPYVLVGGAVGRGSSAWFRALAKAEVTMVRRNNWQINVVVAETHAQPMKFSHLSTSIGRYLLDARTFAAPLGVSQSLGLATVLSQSGVLAASGPSAP